MSIKTLEIRWMLYGKPSTIARAWFDSLATAPARMEARVDKYLPPPDAATNIKLREGRLEIKNRTRRRPSVSHTSPLGIVESWSKCVFTSTEPFDPELVETWISCRKKRRVRWFDIDPPIHYPIERPTPGTSFCQLEISELKALGQDWWSVALETTGPEMETALDHGINHLLSGYPSDELTEAQSMGYPEWLLRLTGNFKVRD